MEDKKQEVFDYFKAQIAACEEKRKQLSSEYREDEATFEKIKANIYDIFQTMFRLATQGKNGEDSDSVQKFFYEKLEIIPRNWRESLQKAEAFQDTEKICIEKIKLSTVEQIHKEFDEIWKREK